MTSFALAHQFSRTEGRVSPRSKRFRTVVLPWKDVPVARFASPLSLAGPGRHWILVAALAASAVLLHANLVWYVVHHTESTGAVSPKHEVAVQIVVPPPPPPPKVVEPPKPPPQRLVKRQVLPQIQTAAPDTPQVDTAPSEPPVAVAPSALEPTPSPPPPPPPEVVTAPFGRAGYLNNPPPGYPAAAARQGWQGTVLLRVRVLSNGRVDGVEVQKSSGHKLLDEEAIATVRGWQFTPSKRGDTPIDGWATVPIEFKLDT
jgi:periplasmic protein TonB